MKLMQIGSSLVNMTDFISVESRAVDEGVVVTIEHKDSIKEYLVPDQVDPELVIDVMMKCINDCARFDLMFMLRLRSGYYADDED